MTDGCYHVSLLGLPTHFKLYGTFRLPIESNLAAYEIVDNLLSFQIVHRDNCFPNFP